MMRTRSSHRSLESRFRRGGVVLRSIVSLAAVFVVSWVAVDLNAQPIQDDYGYSISPRQVSDLFFLDSTRGWISVDDHSQNQSFLLRTTDGGNTWTERKAPKGIIRLSFLSARIGWALVESSVRDGSGSRAFYVASTSDAGDNWTSLQVMVEAAEGAVTDIAFINEKHGWAVGNGLYGKSLVLETFDGGKSFHKLPDLAESIKLARGISAGEKEGVWIYGLGSVLHSTDEGKTWQKSVDLHELGTNTNAFDISSAFFWSSGRGWLAGQDPDSIILGTEDFGRHWTVALRTQEAGNFRAMSFWDEEHGCSASFYPVLLFCTDDGGLKWKSRDVLPPASGDQAKFFIRLIMLKSGRGWALRAGGYLYDTNDGGHSWKPRDVINHL
jgi:photosystem II stability/assembly factor-like uncharacterized protein